MRRLCLALFLWCCIGLQAAAQTPILSGWANDGQVYLPPNWDSFTPPASGQSYVDPVFGCPVKRLPTAASMKLHGMENI